MDQGNTSQAQLHEIFDLQASKGTLKKLEIVKATIDCIATIGYEKTTYEAIALKIGTRRAHIAYYFNNKQDIFKTCVKYIISHYYIVSDDHVSKNKNPKDALMRYVESSYIWSKNNPRQLCSMLLFYYLCSISEEYKDLHDKIRSTGLSKIENILIHDLQLKLNAQESLKLSKAIQNLINGHHIAAQTSTIDTVKESENETKKRVWKLIGPYL